MPEYINREAFKQKLIEKGFFPAIVQRALEEMPSEDVAPKREVEICQHLLKDAWKRIEELNNLCGELQKSKSEVVREIFEEIERLHLHITNEFDLRRYNELKKKYIQN